MTSKKAMNSTGDAYEVEVVCVPLSGRRKYKNFFLCVAAGSSIEEVRATAEKIYQNRGSQLWPKDSCNEISIEDIRKL